MGKRIEPRALGAFVEALERGAHVLEATKAAGVAASSFYRLRKRDPAFAEAWDEAVAKSNAPVLIAPGNGRKLQKRRTRRIRFTRERKERFLAHFAATCDATASAAAAGVCASTVDKHLASDPLFAEGWQAALETGYLALEAELVAQRRAAHRAYRVSPDQDAAGAAKDFDRSLQLLTAWRRKDGSVGRRPGRPQRSDIETARARLEKAMRILGIRFPGSEG